MNKYIIVISISFAFLGIGVPSAMAQTVVTMNQPDNGFYEGPDPEWATLHSSDQRGTPEHRQYHRDAAQEHFLWHQEHHAEQGIVDYEFEHRLFHQERNHLHRQFHTSPFSP